MADLITSKLHYLCNNTCNTMELATLLTERRILKTTEYDTIMSKPEPFSKNCELYTILRKKDSQLSENVLSETLNQTGNGHIASELFTVDTSVCVFPTDNIPNATDHFIGRAEELKNLAQYWTSNVPAVLITGMPGIGKRELAKKFANDCQKSGGNCVWIDKDLNCIKQLADHPKFSLSSKSESNKYPGSLIGNIFTTLLLGRLGRTLFVFDNPEKYIYHYLELLITKLCKETRAGFKKPLVLVVLGSIYMDMNILDKCHEIFLDVLSIEDSKKLLVKHLTPFPGDNFNICNALENDLLTSLCERLGRHPLAMRQAASYLNNKSDKKSSPLNHEIITLLRVLKWRSNIKFLFYSGLELEGCKCIYDCINEPLQFMSKIPQNGEMALNILKCAAFFTTDSISLQPFEQIVIYFCQLSHHSSASKEVRQSLRILRKRSLCKIDSQNGNQFITVNKMVKDVINHNFTQQQYREAFGKIMRIQDHLLQSKKIPYAFVASLIEIWEKGFEFEDCDDRQAKEACYYASILNVAGQYSQCVKFSDNAIDILQRRLTGDKSDNQCLLRLKYWHALASCELDDFDSAVEIFKYILPLQSSLFGKDHRHTKDTFAALAATYTIHIQGEMIENTNKLNSWGKFIFGFKNISSLLRKYFRGYNR